MPAEPADPFAEYLDGKTADLLPIVSALRRLVPAAAPGAVEYVNAWGIPTWEVAGPVCWLGVSNHHVTFGFHRATSLPDPEGLLEGTGKNMRHVKLRKLDEVDRPALRDLVVAAAHLDRELPAKSMGRRKRS